MLHPPNPKTAVTEGFSDKKYYTGKHLLSTHFGRLLCLYPSSDGVFSKMSNIPKPCEFLAPIPAS